MSEEKLPRAPGRRIVAACAVLIAVGMLLGSSLAAFRPQSLRAAQEEEPAAPDGL